MAETIPKSSADFYQKGRPPLYKVSAAIRDAINKFIFKPVVLDSSLDYFPDKERAATLYDLTYECSSKANDYIAAATSMGQTINNERVFVNPDRGTITLFKGQDYLGGRDTAALGAEMVMENPSRSLDALRKVNDEMAKNGDISYLSVHIHENAKGEKILCSAEMENNGDFELMVFGPSGETVEPEYQGYYFLEKGARVVLVSKGVGISADDLYGVMLKGKNGGMKSPKEVMKTLSERENTSNQSIAIVDIK